VIVLKIALSVAVLLAAVELAKRDTFLGALVIVLPLTSMLAIVLLYNDTGDAARVSRYAREIFYLVPVSLLFFLPFLFEPRTHLPFWGNFAAGIVLMAAAAAAIRFLIK
jgi:hypothetical protein